MTVLGAVLFGVMVGFGVAISVGWRINAERARASRLPSNGFDAQVGQDAAQPRDGDWLAFWTVTIAIYAAGIITQPVLFWALGGWR